MAFAKLYEGLVPSTRGPVPICPTHLFGERIQRIGVISNSVASAALLLRIKRTPAIATP